MLAASQTRTAAMPVTAKLSRAFYERLGDEIANELVNWFNTVDASYRADLDRLNELNFQRFDAKVEQRFAEADAKVERRLAELRVEIEQRFAELEIKIEQRFAAFDRRLADVRADLIKWAFLFWMPTALAVLGLYFR
jgi:hypothetical protein